MTDLGLYIGLNLFVFQQNCLNNWIYMFFIKKSHIIKKVNESYHR